MGLALVRVMTDALPVVAVVNTSPDVLEILRLTLQHAGIVTVSAMSFDLRDGRVDIEAFMRQHRPRVIIYDIAAPYERNWQLFLHMQEIPAMKDVQFVLTSTNPKHVHDLPGAHGQNVCEIVGKPHDLDRIVQAVKEALHARPTR